MASTPGLLIPILFNLLLLLGAQAEQCGSQASGAKCSDNLCCSQYGWCGSTSDYCGTGCQSQCSGSSGSGSGVGSIISSSTFNDFFPSKNSFYTYSSFINAANAFTSFGTTGSSDDKKREIAAFFANVKQETGGLVYIKEEKPSSNYCDSSNTQYPCASGKSYYGRGPMQLSWNYNYGACGSYLGLNLLNNPDLLEQNADDSFKSALWFWTQSPSSSSSCHAAMVGGSGFGKTIKIINGGIECGKGSETTQASNRISYYKSFCSKLGVDPGSNLSCA